MRCSAGWSTPSASRPPDRRRPAGPRPGGPMMFKQPTVRRKTPDQIARMRVAGRVVAEMHEKIRAAIRPGVTTADLDAIGRHVIERRGALSNFLGYNGTYPGVICASPNDMIVHG